MLDNETIQEVARAGSEVAKTVGKAIDTSAKAGGFFDEVFGNLIKDAVGLASDKLRFYRVEKFYLLEDKTKKNLKSKGIDTTRFVSPKIGIPLIEHATIEDNDSLHTRWANMLANAMNPEFKNNLNRSYISILGDMEPLDVLILDSLVKEYTLISDIEKNRVLFESKKIATNLVSGDSNQCDISLRNLIRLGCLKPGVVIIEGISAGGHKTTAYKDTELVGITSLGIEFMKAVS